MLEHLHLEPLLPPDQGFFTRIPQLTEFASSACHLLDNIFHSGDLSLADAPTVLEDVRSDHLAVMGLLPYPIPRSSSSSSPSPSFFLLFFPFPFFFLSLFLTLL
jgi:hypothetical protein